MKPLYLLIGVLSLLGIFGSISPITAQTQRKAGRAFICGNYSFYFRQRGNNGLLRNVAVRSISPLPKYRNIYYAQYARRKPNTSGVWILGSVIVRQYGLNGRLFIKSAMKQAYIYTE